MIVLGILLSTVAAFCYAFAAVQEHGAVHAVRNAGGPAHGRLRMGELGAIIRRRGWLLGLLAQFIGASVHTVALAFAPLMVVQPIGVLAIGMTAVLATRAPGARLDRATGLAVLASTIGVMLFVFVASRGARDAAIPPGTVHQILPMSGGAVVALVIAALASRGWMRSPLFATAAGISYAAVSVLTRIFTRHLRTEGWTGLPILAVIGAVVAMAIGAWCLQQAYVGGRADAVQACQTVVDPLVAVMFGVLLFHEVRHPGVSMLVIELASGALAVVGVVALARRTHPNRRRIQ